MDEDVTTLSNNYPASPDGATGNVIPRPQPEPDAPVPGLDALGTTQQAPDVRQMFPESQGAPQQAHKSFLGRLAHALPVILAGAAEGAGAKTVGDAAARGVQAGRGIMQQRFENEQTKARNDAAIHFQNVQAAETVARTAMYDKQLHYLDQQQQDEHNARTLGQMQELQKMGIMPTLVTDNHAQGASAGLQQLTNSHGGVPNMFTLNLGDRIVAYDLGQLTKSNAVLDQVNQIANIQGKGQQAFTPGTWAQLSESAKEKIIQDSLNFFNPMPSPQTVGPLIQQYQNYLNTYKMRPDADKGVVDRLQQTVGFLQGAQQGFDKHETQQRFADASADEQARKPFKDAERADAYNKAVTLSAIQQGNAEATIGDNGRAVVKATPPVIDPFGNQLPSMPMKVREARQKDFNKTYADPLVKLEKTTSQMDQILGRKNMTGADKVVALFDAIGISAEPMKGNGFRVNNAVISEHSEARPLYEDIVQKANKIAGSGGPVTEQQLKDYTQLIKEARNTAYVAAANVAQTRGLPIDFIPRGNNKVVDKDTAKIFLDIAGGDRVKAQQALQQAGWKIPQQ